MNNHITPQDMKYYHIIYNSSEKPMVGGVGFGIRTATEGTPKELLKAINGITFFASDWESYSNKPSAAKMKEDPSSIEIVPKNYAVTGITDGQGRTYTLIARRAYVGFDYGFYKNGVPTRPGNYVIDYYVFDSTPDSSVYEILYEKALPGSNHFIPMSVRPTEDNEEMREISVGAQPPLPPVDKPFTAAVDNALDKDVVRLFFTYLKSRQNGRKLVVKANRDKALKLTADLYRMLDPESAKTLRVYVNHRSQGINDNFDIFFIHEDYPHQIYPALYDYIEIDSAVMPDTEESRTFGDQMENFVKDSFKENKDDIHDTLKWLMMPEYTTVKRLSDPTIESFFFYCIQPNNFTYENLFPDGKPNDEFLKVLYDYTKNDDTKIGKFKEIVIEKMNDATPEDVVGLIKEYNHLIKMGFNLDDVTETVKHNVCTRLLSDIGIFKEAIDTMGISAIGKFFDKEVFERNNGYLDQSTLDTYMPSLYKWFMTGQEDKNIEEFLYSRFLKRNMSRDVFHRIIDDVYGTDEDSKIDFFIRCLKEKGMDFPTIWPYLSHYLDRSPRIYDFTEIFSEHTDDPEYAPMFHHSIIKKKRHYAMPENIGKLTEILSINPGLKLLVVRNNKTDGIYDELYRNLDTSVEKDPCATLEVLRKNIIDSNLDLDLKDDRFKILEVYLYLKCSKDTSIINDCKHQLLKQVYEKLNDHSDKELFDALLPYFVKASRQGVIVPLDLASQFRKYHPVEEISTDIMLKRLAPYKDWTDMIGAVIATVDNKPFKEAMEIANVIGMDEENIDKLLTRFYEKDYNTYKRNQKIKNIFSSVGKLFKSKNKDKEENPEEVRDEKPRDGNKSKSEK